MAIQPVAGKGCDGYYMIAGFIGVWSFPARLLCEALKIKKILCGPWRPKQPGCNEPTTPLLAVAPTSHNDLARG
jgi:hypothetical protein